MSCSVKICRMSAMRRLSKIAHQVVRGARCAPAPAPAPHPDPLVALGARGHRPNRSRTPHCPPRSGRGVCCWQEGNCCSRPERSHRVLRDRLRAVQLGAQSHGVVWPVKTAVPSGWRRSSSTVPAWPPRSLVSSARRRNGPARPTDLQKFNNVTHRVMTDVRALGGSGCLPQHRADRLGSAQLGGRSGNYASRSISAPVSADSRGAGSMGVRSTAP